MKVSALKAARTMAETNTVVGSTYSEINHYVAISNSYAVGFLLLSKVTDAIGSQTDYAAQNFVKYV